MTNISGRCLQQNVKARPVHIGLPDFDNMAATAYTRDDVHTTQTFDTRHAYRASLEGTMLFDHVRDRFCEGISTLDSVLSSMKLGNIRSGSIASRQDIDRLLHNLIAMARWLVGFLQTATACSRASPWARSAITGLRVELHRYSHKVMHISGILQSVNAFRSGVARTDRTPTECDVLTSSARRQCWNWR